MGVWERVGTLLSGGARVEVELDSDRVASGGFLSGHAELAAGRRGAQFVGLHVSLVQTAVRPPGGSTTSEIRQKTIVDTTIGSGLKLEPRSQRRVQFSFRVPREIEPSDDDTSYRVRVEAESAHGRAPTDHALVRVVDAAAGRPSLSLILERFPGLNEDDGSPLLDALVELRWAHDGLDPERDLIAAEPQLSRLVTEGNGQIRAAALEAWSSVVAGRVGDDHVRLLSELAEDGGAEPGLLIVVIAAAGRMTSARGLAVLKPLADHAKASVRRAVAQAVAKIDKRPSKYALLQSMQQDPDAGVRAAVYRAMTDFADDGEIVSDIAGHTTVEPSSQVLQACVSVLEAAFGHGHAAVVRPAFDRLSRHPKADVRVALARALYFAEQDEEAMPIARALLRDSDEEVRYAAASEIRNLPVRGRSLFPVIETMANDDPSPRARRGALTSLPEFMPADRVVESFEALVEQDAEAEVLRGVIDGIKFRREPQYRGLLEALADHGDDEVAAEAKAALDAKPN